MKIVRILTPLAFLFVVACSDADPGTSNDNTAGDDDTTLPDDSECEADEVEDGAGNCHLACSADEDCGSIDFICSDEFGFCIDRPVCNPALCSTGFTCPTDGGYDCVALPGWCASDDDCGLTERCEDHACISRAGDIIATCEEDGDCGFGMTCQFGVCVGCIDDLQCCEDIFNCDGARCVAGTCIVADIPPAVDCLSVDCPDGEKCDLTTGICQPTCESDDDCGEGQTCAPVINQCKAEFGCETGEDCITGECQLNLCIGCLDDSMCRDSESCSVGVCFPKLDESIDYCEGITCGSGELCDSVDGSCYPADGTCDNDDHCRGAQTCNMLSFCTGCSVEQDCRPGQQCTLSMCVSF
ncbi:hypothetical protein KAI87_07140 [Myxococcota bacterium]|nr:hypothetical protein [Myxococcota bacterium]